MPLTTFGVFLEPEPAPAEKRALAGTVKCECRHALELGRRKPCDAQVVLSSAITVHLNLRCYVIVSRCPNVIDVEKARDQYLGHTTFQDQKIAYFQQALPQPTSCLPI